MKSSVKGTYNFETELSSVNLEKKELSEDFGVLEKQEYNDTALQTWSLHTCCGFFVGGVFLLVFLLVVLGFFPLNRSGWLVGAVTLQEKFWSSISF